MRHPPENRRDAAPKAFFGIKARPPAYFSDDDEIREKTAP
jgi:hypothetical protein